jgi:hypothetical protein
MAASQDALVAAAQATTAAVQALAQVRSNNVKVPKFLTFDVALWQQQCEAAFTLAGVTDQAKKFAHVAAALEPDITRRVAAYVAAPSPSGQFDGLCAALHAAFDKTIAEKTAAIQGLALGDTRPSEMYHTMVRLWPDPHPETSALLWFQFLQKLPAAVALHLDEGPGTTSSRETRLTLADSLCAEHAHRSAASTLVGAITDDKRSRRQFSNEGTATTPCFYHKRFGDKARACRAPCSMAKRKSTQIATVLKPLYGSADGHAQWVSTRQAVYLAVKVAGKRMIADTGASCSIVPASKEERRAKPNLELFHAANRTPIACYGKRVITFDLGLGRLFRHSFFTCDVSDPLLGYDFFLSNRLIVDCVYNRLLDVDSLRFAPGMEPAKVSQVLPSPALLGKFSYLWSKYSGLVDPSVERFRAAPKHDVKHHITLRQKGKNHRLRFRPRQLFQASKQYFSFKNAFKRFKNTFNCKKWILRKILHLKSNFSCS